MKKFVITLAVILALLLTAAVGLTIQNRIQEERDAAMAASSIPTETAQPTTEPTLPPPPPTTQPPTEATEPPTEPTEPEPTRPPFEPHCTPDTDPANWNTNWEVIVGDELVEEYTREEPIFFEDGEYFQLPGVASFRGGNYRNEASYGTVNITENTLTQLWGQYVGGLGDPGWGGCGWTGQPLVVQWDAETRAIMNLYEDKKNKEGLTEVIYAKMDGYIHCFDIDDGSATRDPIFVGMTFKGSGAIDPRGYPIAYVGAGLEQNGKQQCMFAVSLIDGSILHEWSGTDALTLRWWFGFDGAPLIHADTDTLIWGGENGLLYTIKLNTQYDKAAGTLTMDPEPAVKSRYMTDYGRSGRYLGYEASVTAVDEYLFLPDNGGMLQCVNVNTMDIVWEQDMVDDVNATCVFEWGEDGNGYLYTAPSMDYSGNGHGLGLPMCRIDAQTGEILWTHYLDCTTDEGIPGGALASPLLGKAGSDIENLIIFSIGKSPNQWTGQVVALNKQTGEVVWQFETGNYMWSSPIALYTEAGKSYLFQADASGNCYLLDGLTGEQLTAVSLGATIESSPIAFNDRIVIGTRSGMYLLKVS